MIIIQSSNAFSVEIKTVILRECSQNWILFARSEHHMHDFMQNQLWNVSMHDPLCHTPNVAREVEQSTKHGSKQRIKRTHCACMRQILIMMNHGINSISFVTFHIETGSKSSIPPPFPSFSLHLFLSLSLLCVLRRNMYLYDAQGSICEIDQPMCQIS